MSVDRKRRAGAVALSLGLHATALLLLVTQAVHHFAPEATARRPVDLEIVGARRATGLPGESDTPAAAHPVAQAPSGRVRVRPTSRAIPPPARSTVAGSTGAGPSASNPGVASAAPGAASENVGAGGDLRGMLRTTVGCSHQEYLRLDDAERRICDDRIAQALRDAPRIDAIPTGRRVTFDAQAAQDEGHRQRREAPLPELVVACDGPKSNLDVACVPAEAIHHMH